MKLSLLGLLASLLCILGCADEVRGSVVRASANDLVGRVVKVADGDTITILDSSKTQHKIRLQGIDAPEKNQAYGDAAGHYLSGLVAGKEVRVAWSKRDKYNRILGTVYANGEEVNLEMLKSGYAWHYKRFDSTPAYAQAESAARAVRRGLWAGLDPVPPEQFRHGVPSPSATPGRDGVPSPSASSTRTEYHAGRTLPVSARTPAPVNAIWPDTGYWLSTNSNKRHNRNCENYRKTRGYPCSSSDGTPCGKCGG